MTTPTIQKNLDALLAARAKEHITLNEERKRTSRRYHKRRALKWTEKQPPFWKIVRGKNWRPPTPSHLLGDVLVAEAMSAKMRRVRAGKSDKEG
jgi:hypothetical protein